MRLLMRVSSTALEIVLIDVASIPMQVLSYSAFRAASYSRFGSKLTRSRALAKNCSISPLTAVTLLEAQL